MSFLVGIPSVMLFGFIFPRETMPSDVVAFSALLPTTWSLQIARAIALREAGLEDLAPALAGSATLGVTYVCLGALQLRRGSR